MKNHPRFRIPLGWAKGVIEAKHPTIEWAMSDTLVIPVGKGISYPFEVERVHGSWAPHIPEKTPHYRVETETFLSRVRYDEYDATRLAQVSIGSHILIELPTGRSTQRCSLEKGVWHGIQCSDGWGYEHLHTYCGESLSNTSLDKLREHRHRAPDCLRCLSAKTVWVLFRVFPFKPKQVVTKLKNKEAHEQKRRARLPTAYDRILDDDFLENPKYKPEKIRPIVSEPDPLAVYEVDPRERKLATARDHNQRIKAVKRNGR